MHAAVASAPPVQVPRWRELVWPKEHGSWSLALEPLALGLIAAPSLGGMALAVAAAAGFFVRRPLRIGVADHRAERRQAARRAAVTCGAIALAAWFGALAVGGAQWLIWLAPAALAGALFLYFDLQQEGREQHAEIAGAFAFASLPAAFAVLAGWSAPAAATLGFVMIVRAVPTVLTVRATVRARKTGRCRPALPVTASIAGALAVALLARVAMAPWLAAALAVVLALRAFGLLVYPRPVFRASTIGMIEAGFGIAYVIGVGIAWRL